jgi:hypothetical protein
LRTVATLRRKRKSPLALEAEICYATIAMVTDYDCWREGHDTVTVEQIVAVLHQNADNAAKVVKAAVAALPGLPMLTARALEPDHHKAESCANPANFANSAAPPSVSSFPRSVSLYGRAHP